MIEVSMMTMNWAVAITPSPSHRRGWAAGARLAPEGEPSVVVDMFRTPFHPGRRLVRYP
jgi:hypothetical protein